MTLLELSRQYETERVKIRTRMSELRAAERAETDPAAAESLRTRLAALGPLLRELREVRDLTARYYDRSYHKDEKYTL